MYTLLAKPTVEKDLRAIRPADLRHLDLAVADRWGRLLAEVQRSVPTIDCLLAATALHYELRVVIRNAGDFVYPGLEVVDPFQHVR